MFGHDCHWLFWDVSSCGSKTSKSKVPLGRPPKVENAWRNHDSPQDTPSIFWWVHGYPTRGGQTQKGLAWSGQISKCQVQWIPSSWGLAWHPHKLGLSQIFVAGREVFTSPDSSTKPCLEMERRSKDWCNWCDCNYIGLGLQLVWYTLYTIISYLYFAVISLWFMMYVYYSISMPIFSWGVITQMVFKIIEFETIWKAK